MFTSILALVGKAPSSLITITTALNLDITNNIIYIYYNIFTYINLYLLFGVSFFYFVTDENFKIIFIYYVYKIFRIKKNNLNHIDNIFTVVR